MGYHGSGLSPEGGQTMVAPSVAAVILNWNRPADTLGCLRSLAAGDYPNWHATVVDNASSDDSVARIRAGFPQAEVLVNERNLGFAGGANVGLAHALAAGHPYILLLNNDTEVEATALSTLVATAEAHPRAGVLSPLILYEDGRIWFAGAYRRRLLPGIFMPAYRRKRSLSPRPFPIDYATGCAMLLRRETLLEVGLLDDSYFMYWEDLDLGERVRRRGWQVLLVPTAVVRHQVSASTGEESPTKWYYLARYMPIFYRRYYRWPRFSMLAYAAWVVVRELLRGNAGVIGPFLRGFDEGWRQEIAGRGSRAPASGV